MPKKSIELPNIQKTSISEQVFNIIKTNIASGNWKAGDRIPSETELAAQFGISRMSVRSALQRLISLGLIESRVGEGTFVKQFDLAEYFKEATNILDTSITMSDINEFRIFFDNSCISLACERCTETDIDELKSIYADMESCAKDGDFDNFYSYDIAFHKKITDITHNSLYEMINALLQNLLRAHYEENLYMYMSMAPKSEKNYKDALVKLAQKHLNYITAMETNNPDLLIKGLTADLASFNKQRKTSN